MGFLAALPTAPSFMDYEVLDEMTRDLYRQGVAAFGGIAPTYHIALLDRPTIIWDFHSLLLCLQMMFSFLLTDTDSTLKACKHCNKIFSASRPNAELCSPQCKNRYTRPFAKIRDSDKIGV